MKHACRLPFKYTLFVSLLSLSVLMLIILGWQNYRISKRTIEENYKKDFDSYMELFSSAIEVQLDDIIDDERSLLSKTDFMYIMKNGGTESSFYFKNSEQKVIDSYFNEIENRNEFIRGLLILNNHGSFRYVRKQGTSYSIEMYYHIGNLLDSEWVNIADEANGREVVVGWNVLDENDDSTFSVIKKMNDINTGEGCGYVVATVSKKLIRHILGVHTDVLENCSYMIIESRVAPDAPHYLVYSNNIDEDMYGEIMDAYNSDNSTEYVFGSFTESHSQWKIISVVTKTELENQSNYIRQTTMQTIVFALIASILLSLVLTSVIDKPLANLEEAISEIAEGNYRPNVEFDNTEIGKVGRYLLETAENNIQLREKLLSSQLNEREAQLQLLLSQMNPHFLYNTLDALYFMAVIDKADDVAEMVKELSDIFKLSLNDGNQLISIRDQIRLADSYMSIMNKRYQNRFTLEKDISEEILDYKILNYLIQPIIENAVTHGLENKIGNGRVSIVGYRDEDEIKIIVNDNGVGIKDKSVIDEGYGIKNVRERVMLYYGEEYDVSFESEVGVGTTVFFRFPVKGVE